MASAGWRRGTALPGEVPVFPLDQALLLPGAVLPLQIFEPRYLNMFDDAMASERLIGMVQTAGAGDRQKPGLAAVGCVGRITSFSETEDGKYITALTGVCRFRILEELETRTPYRIVRADFRPFRGDLDSRQELSHLDRRTFIAALRRYLERRGLGIDWETVDQAPYGSLVDSLAIALPLPRVEKQALLEAADTADRLGVLLALLEMDAARPGDPDDDASPSVQ